MIPLRVGICIIEYTRNKLQLPRLLQVLCKDGSMEFVVIDMNTNLSEQGHFDVIIHKILEWYNLGEEHGDGKLRKLLNYVRANPHIKMLDSVEETVRLANRVYSMDVMRDCSFTMNGIKVFVPKSFFLEANNPERAQQLITKSGMNFPVITKPPVTRCDVEAHDMAIIFSEQSVGDIAAPCVVQEFINHGSLLYKVYAVDDIMYICERPSVKDLQVGCEPTVYFDSMTVSKRNIYNARLHAENPRKKEFRTTAGSCKHLLDEDVVKELLRRINNRINLTLFGIDIILEEKTGNYCIIDLNYLPSYDGVLEYFAADLYRKLCLYNAKRMFGKLQRCNLQNLTARANLKNIGDVMNFANTATSNNAVVTNEEVTTCV